MAKTMKLLTAIIKPSRLEDVRQALNALDVHAMTVSRVQGYGRQGGRTELYRGTEYAMHHTPKLKLEIGIEDEKLDAVCAALSTVARTGRIGDGKILVLGLEKALRIRTGETGPAAL